MKITYIQGKEIIHYDRRNTQGQNKISSTMFVKYNNCKYVRLYDLKSKTENTYSACIIDVYYS
jgi:hypothetical protein